MVFFKVVKLKSVYEKPSEKKKKNFTRKYIRELKSLINLKIEFKYTAGWSSLVARQGS